MSRDSQELEAGVASVDDSVARLVRLAGPRSTASDELTTEVRDAVHQHWQGRVRRRREARRFVRRRRVLSSAALAAAAVTVLVLGWRFRPAPPAPLAIGSVETVLGPVWETSGGERRTLVAGDVITLASALETEGSVALRLDSGASVRLAAATRARWDAENALRLESGAVYVDSDRLEAAALEVRTVLGTAREIGTQFEVRLEGDILKVRIREGRVALDTGSEEHAGGAGDEMIWSAAGRLTWGKVPIHGEFWDWTLALAASPPIAELRLDAFLAWVARETGYEVYWTDPTLAARAASEVIVGLPAGLGPKEAAESFLPTLGLAGRFEDGQLIIEETAPQAQRY